MPTKHYFEEALEDSVMLTHKPFRKSMVDSYTTAQPLLADRNIDPMGTGTFCVVEASDNTILR